LSSIKVAILALWSCSDAKLSFRRLQQDAAEGGRL
jgi:hypothetical protein